MPTAASAIPYNPARLKVIAIAAQRVNTGTTVDNIPTDNPPMIIGPAPASACADKACVGLYSYAV